jgi:Tol biopolymer transport system component
MKSNSKFHPISHLRLILLLVSPYLSGYSLAQDNSDLFVVDTKNSLFGFKVDPISAIHVTEREGYDNQPYFINNEQLVFTSMDEGGSSDIIMFNFETGKFTNITRTPKYSEYSPALTDCGQYISAVKVEEEGRQRLWLYPINLGEPELLYDDIEPVAYYGWVGDIAALMVLGEPNRLVFPYSREEIHEIATNIGRSVRARPKSDQITYLDKSGNTVVDGRQTYVLKAFDIKEKKKEDLGLALGGSEDFIWISKNQVLMARGMELYLRNVKKGIRWERIATLDLPGYSHISRLALNPKGNKLVVVVEKEAG